MSSQPKTDEAIPLARLDLYAETIILTKFGRMSTTSYPVSIHDLSTAFNSLPSSSGFLPRNALFHGRQRGQQFIGIYIPAEIATVTVETTMMHIPLPQAIFIGCGRLYSIHAVSEYPKNRHARLYHYPSPNVWNDGRICRGNTLFPTCRPDTIHQAFKMFVESRFNNHLVTGKCLHGLTVKQKLSQKCDQAVGNTRRSRPIPGVGIGAQLRKRRPLDISKP